MEKINSDGYNLEVGPIGDSSLSDFLAKNDGNKVVIIADENTHELCVALLIGLIDELSNAEIMVLPVGEESKELFIAENVWSTFIEYEITRHDLILNVG